MSKIRVCVSVWTKNTLTKKIPSCTLAWEPTAVALADNNCAEFVRSVFVTVANIECAAAAVSSVPLVQPVKSFVDFPV